jgi:hypothetical protein
LDPPLKGAMDMFKAYPLAALSTYGELNVKILDTQRT